MTTAYITHPDCLLHEMGEHHPESPSRLQVIEDALKEQNLFDFLQYHEAPLATKEQVELAHDKKYIESIESLSPRSGYYEIDGDTLMNPQSLRAAYLAAGANILAVDLVLAGKVENAFCNVRPPGHHAERNQAMGFCFFNNVAVAACYALKSGLVKRVAIIDFDVHHGNGTEHIFLDNSQVLICSTFEEASFPNKPFKTTSDRIINVPLSPGSHSHDFREGIEREWFPAIEKFKPDMFFISAGFDAHRNDPLADLRLGVNDFIWVTEKIMYYAERFAQKRIVSTLEGGYNLGALALSATAHIRTLMHLN